MRILLIALFVACSKTSAPPPPPAPVPVAPSHADRFARAGIVLRDFASGKPAKLPATSTFAWVDYSTRPAGDRNRIEMDWCALDNDPGLAGVQHQLAEYRGQLAQAIADDALKCKPYGQAIVFCEVRAREEGEATLTFAVDGDTLIGFAKYETFMIDDPSKDERRRDEALARLWSEPCQPARPSTDDACCCSVGGHTRGTKRSACQGTCGEMTEACITDLKID